MKLYLQPLQDFFSRSQPRDFITVTNKILKLEEYLIEALYKARNLLNRFFQIRRI